MPFFSTPTFHILIEGKLRRGNVGLHKMGVRPALRGALFVFGVQTFVPMFCYNELKKRGRTGYADRKSNFYLSA